MGFSPNLNFANGAKAQKLDFTAYPPAKAGGNSCASSLDLRTVISKNFISLGIIGRPRIWALALARKLRFGLKPDQKEVPDPRAKARGN